MLQPLVSVGNMQYPICNVALVVALVEIDVKQIERYIDSIECKEAVFGFLLFCAGDSDMNKIGFIAAMGAASFIGGAQAQALLLDSNTLILNLPQVVFGTNVYQAKLHYDADGRFSLVSGVVTSTIAPPLVTDIVEGNYRDSVGATYSLQMVPNLTADGRKFAYFRATQFPVGTQSTAAFAANIATGPVTNHPFVTNSTTRSYCSQSQLGGGLFGYAVSDNNRGVGTASSYSWSGTAIRLRRADQNTIVVEAVQNDCSITSSQIMTKVG